MKKIIVKWFNRNAKKGEAIAVRTGELAKELGATSAAIVGVMTTLRDEKGWAIQKMEGPPVYWLVMKPPLLGGIKENPHELVSKE